MRFFFFFVVGISISNSKLICTEIMASCHNLSLVGGQISGDPLEIELLNASGWTLRKSADSTSLMDVTPSESREKYSILKHFEFSADKLRAGTILKRPNGELVYLLKGSPEMVINISGTLYLLF